MAKKNKQQENKGPKRKVFISNVEHVPGAKEGEFTFKVFLGINVTVKESAPVRVWINGKFVGMAEVAGRTEKEYTEVKLDLKKDQDVVEVKVEDITTRDTDHLDIPATAFKKSAGTATSSAAKTESKWFKVIVGPLSPNNTAPVTVLTYDDQGKPGEGIVLVNAGQKIKLNGKTYKAGDACPIVNKVDGMSTNPIQLLECNAVVAFTHVPSGDTIRKTLLKEQ